MLSKLKLKLLCVLLVLASPICVASTQVAMVVAVKGAVTVQRDTQVDDRLVKSDTSLSQGSHVYVGDSITAGVRSFAVLQFVDGAKVTIRPNSEMSINVYDYETENPQAELGLVSGGLRILTGALAKTNPDDFKVQTPVALMGVRGTEFSVQMCGNSVCDAVEENDH